MLAYKKDWKIEDDSNAIRYIVLFITGKMHGWIFTSMYFVSSENDYE